MTASSVSGSAGGLKATAARVLFEELEQMIIDRLQDFDANFNEQEIHGVYDLAVSTLDSLDRRKRLQQALLRCLVNLPVGHLFANHAVKILWGICSSNSGAEVHTCPPRVQTGSSSRAGRVGVLILGFAGANIGMLSLHERTYNQLHPQWAVTSLVVSGLRVESAQTRIDAQLRHAEGSLSTCSRVLVHAISNNGAMSWRWMLRSFPDLTRKVRAIVFDCAACPLAEYSQSALCEVITQTILSSALLHGLEWQQSHEPRGRGTSAVDQSGANSGAKSTEKSVSRSEEIASDRRSRAALDAHVRRAVEVHDEIDLWGLHALHASGLLSTGVSGDDGAAWQAAADPCVPMLMMTSHEDTVVPAAGVRAFGRMLLAAQPGRPVRMAVLRGRHVGLLSACRDAYLEELRALIRVAKLDETEDRGETHASAETSREAPLNGLGCEQLEHSHETPLGASFGASLLTSLATSLDTNQATSLESLPTADDTRPAASRQEAPDAQGGMADLASDTQTFRAPADLNGTDRVAPTSTNGASSADVTAVRLDSTAARLDSTAARLVGTAACVDGAASAWSSLDVVYTPRSHSSQPLPDAGAAASNSTDELDAPYALHAAQSSRSSQALQASKASRAGHALGNSSWATASEADCAREASRNPPISSSPHALFAAASRFAHGTHAPLAPELTPQLEERRCSQPFSSALPLLSPLPPQTPSQRQSQPPSQPIIEKPPSQPTPTPPPPSNSPPTVSPPPPLDEALVSKLLTRLERLAEGRGVPLGKREIERLRDACDDAIAETTPQSAVCSAQHEEHAQHTHPPAQPPPPTAQLPQPPPPPPPPPSPLRRRLLAALCRVLLSVDGLNAAAHSPRRALCASCAVLAARLAATADGPAVASFEWQSSHSSHRPGEWGDAATKSDVSLLLLGFAGGSAHSLLPIVATYANSHVRKVVIATAAVPFYAAETLKTADVRARQMAEIVRALNGCGRVVVHVVSAHGHRLWLCLLREHADFVNSRVAALVLEGCPALHASLTAETERRLAVASMLETATQLGLDLTEGTALTSAAAEDLLAAAFSTFCDFGGTSFITDEELDWEIMHDPAVPKLFLAGEHDDVVPLTVLQRAAAAMRSQRPNCTRSVTLRVLPGQHCALHASDPEAYGRAVRDHVAHALSTD